MSMGGNQLVALMPMEETPVAVAVEVVGGHRLELTSCGYRKYRCRFKSAGYGALGGTPL